MSVSISVLREEESKGEESASETCDELDTPTSPQNNNIADELQRLEAKIDTYVRKHKSFVAAKVSFEVFEMPVQTRSDDFVFRQTFILSDRQLELLKNDRGILKDFKYLCKMKNDREMDFTFYDFMKKVTTRKRSMKHLERKLGVLWTEGELIAIMRETRKELSLDLSSLSLKCIVNFLNDMVNTMESDGRKFVKYRKSKSPCPVWIVIGGWRLYWKDDPSHRNRKSRSLSLHKIQMIRHGKVTAALKQASRNSEQRCFTIIVKKRTLDLEAPNKIITALFVKYLKAYVKHVQLLQ